METEKSDSDFGDKTGPSKMSDAVNSSVRLQRNQAEKQRRDRLNGYISELATLVPMVKNSSKPVDKVSVLRLAAAHMRLNISCLNPVRFKSKSSILPSSITSYLEILEKNVGGFIIATTFAGCVIFCSKAVEDFLGYQNIDFMGQSVYNYIPSKEVARFEKKVNSVISRYRKGNSKKISKSILLHLQKRPLPRTNDINYQKVLIKISVHSNDIQNKQSRQDEKIPVKGKKLMKYKDFATSAVVLMFIEPVKSTPKIPIPFSLKQEDVYVTLHGIRGEIIEADHNISTVTGYMPCDVLGKSAYEYIFETDVPIAQFAQKAMFTSNDGKGIITYRLRTFNMKYIFLQSTGFLFKDSANEIQRFICYNRWLSDEVGESELKKFQERFSPASFAARQLEAQKNNSDTEVLCLNPGDEEVKNACSITESSLSNHAMQSLKGFENNLNYMNMLVAKHIKNVEIPVNESNGSFNKSDLHNESGYLCNQPLNAAKGYSESNEMDMEVKFQQNTQKNGYSIEKMEVCSYYPSTDLTLEKNSVKHEKNGPQSLKSHEKVQNSNLMQCASSFGEGDTSVYFRRKNGDGNSTLFQEENVSTLDPYITQTEQISSSLQQSDCHSYQEPIADHHSNVVNLMPSHMNFYKVTESVSYNHVNMPSDRYNSVSPNEPFVTIGPNGHSYDQCNSRQVGLLDGECTHQSNRSYPLNSSKIGAFCNIQQSKIPTYNNNFSSSDVDVYDDVDIYKNGLNDHDAFEFQKIDYPNKTTLNCLPETMHSSQVNYLDVSRVFSTVYGSDKWELLNNSSDYKNKKQFTVETVINSKDSRFQSSVLETVSETVGRKGNLCEKPIDQSFTPVPSASNENSFDSRVNQELYNELDMFFENFPLSDSAQNQSSF